MKKIRSIQFKVFICLFISFMVVFGYIVKTKYDQSFNELVYNTDYTASDDYINFCNTIDSRGPHQVELDLEKIKKELGNLPKDDMTEICLLDAKGKLINQYGYNKKDRLLIASSPFVESDDSNDYYNLEYYIDLSELSNKQYKLLKDTIKDVDEKGYDEINLCFEGQIEELQNFKETSQLIYNAKIRYFKVTPTFIHYNTDIFGKKQGNSISATLEAYVDDGDYHLSRHGEVVNDIKKVSTLKMNQLTKDAIDNHFSNIYVRLASFLDKDTITSKENRKMTNEIATSIQEGTLTYATFTKLLDDYSYQVLLMPLYKYQGYTEGQEHTPEAFIAVFYDFQSGGRNQLRNDLIKDNLPLLLGGFLFIVLFSFLISYMTTRRIKEIDRVAMEITNNNFKGVLDTKGHDELSSLSSHINTMSSNLKRNIDALNLEIDQVKKMEQLRKEFIAQFTHEIKTPLAIINGNIDLLENEILDSLAFIELMTTLEEEFNIEKITGKLKFPMFVKPSNSGSSVGVKKATNNEELKMAIENAGQYDNKILIEQGINAREVECAILDGTEVRASTVGEIMSAEEFYSFDAKYNIPESKTIIPADISKEQIEQIQKLAIRAFKAIDGSGLARVDFFIEKDTNKIYINEINTMPGFTKISMYPKLFEAVGIKYSELLDKLIANAIKD